MQQNILKNTEVTKIFFIYKDGKGINRKETVTIRYMDDKYCYFAGQIPINFTKLKWRTKADIVVYTPDGVYSAQVIVKDTSCSLREILYQVDIPKTWQFKQLRAGTRKQITLPLTLDFSNEVILEAETVDLSIGGFSFVSEKNLTMAQRSFPATLKMIFPKDSIISFPDGVLETEAKFVRAKPVVNDYEKEGWNRYSFKFVKLDPDQKLVLKNFLIKLI